MGKMKFYIQMMVCFFCLPTILFGISSSVWAERSDYDGLYAGTYNGDDNGIWAAVIDSTTFTAGFIAWSTDFNRGDIAWLTAGGEVAGPSYKYYNDDTYIQHSSITSYIHADRSVSGEWNNTYSNHSGNLMGDMVNSTSFAGSYSGSFSGDDKGSWVLTITNDGGVTGTLNSDNDGDSSFEGVCHPAGWVFCIGTTPDRYPFGVFATIVGSDISGWWAASDQSQGTLTSGTDTNDDGDGDGGGGGGGGCFISTLIQQISLAGFKLIKSRLFGSAIYFTTVLHQIDPKTPAKRLGTVSPRFAVILIDMLTTNIVLC